jgi:asparagine synthase (glutamine-hydrolysing)
LTSSGDLSHILRTLLHRNDSLGMAASIEARFPFLDSQLVKLAVNLPYRCKVRFSPSVWDWEHLFFRDKWIIRKIADRYLPRDLSQRKKRPFPTNAFQRWRISHQFFEDSFVTDLFGLTRPRLKYLLDNASQALKLRLLHLDAWGHVCVRGLSKTKLAERLRERVTVPSRSDRRGSVLRLPANAAGLDHHRVKRKVA